MEFADSILAPGAIRTVFQPIVQVGPRGYVLHALECLSRGPAGTRFADAITLFRAVRRHRLEATVDRACVATALATAASAGIETDLFLNVDPVTLTEDTDFPDYLTRLSTRTGIATSRLTVELVEHGRGSASPALAEPVRRLQSIGIRVALDDFGFEDHDGSLLRTCGCRPDLVKLDGRLFRVAGLRPAVRRRVDAIVRQARRHGVAVVAEGVAREVDVRLATRLRIELMQGHHLCRPLKPRHAARAGSLFPPVVRTA